MGAEIHRLLNRIFEIHGDLSQGIGEARWFAQTGILCLMVGGLVGLGTLAYPNIPDNSVHVATYAAVMDVPTAAVMDVPTVLFNEDIDLGSGLLDAEMPELQQVAEKIITPPPALVPQGPLTKSVIVGHGDTLAHVLNNMSVPTKSAFQAINALGKNFDVRKLQVGQELNLIFDGEQQDQLLALSLKPDVDRVVTTSRNDDGEFYSKVEMLPLQKVMLRAGGTIDGSLYAAMEKAGVAPEVIANLITVFSFDVDFQREIRKGDGFDLYYEQYLDDTGEVAKTGDILYGSLTLRGKPLDLYRFVTKDDGRSDYYNEKGHSVRKALLRTPIDGARLTSRFGRRKHPVLGYTKMHKGADFGARRGTPIRAAGDGVVERASRYGSFGKYVRIRHNGEYQTAYAHMKGYGKGVRKGAKVKQGQIIGYVGTTGRSTGPHLHYEVLKGGKQTNPLGLKLPSGRKLDGPELERFQAMLAERKVAINALPVATQLASND